MLRKVSFVLAIGFILSAAIVVGHSPAVSQGAQGGDTVTLGTGFTYQGLLNDGGGPANGDYDFSFALYDQPASGIQVGSTLELGDVTVNDGLFTLDLDFGAVFDGTDLWLEIGVRPWDQAGAYTILAPRQPLRPTPYASYASRAEWSGLIGLPPGFSDNVDDDTLAGIGCSNGQIIEWNGSAWICGEDDVGAGGGGGDITAVTAGAGLLGGGDSGSVALEVAFAGNGSADTVSRSDHDHDSRYYTQTDLQNGSASVHWNSLNNIPQGLNDGDDDTLDGLACAAGQVAKWDGANWHCA
ncbi:MAG: hypothetical protein PVH18_08755, partial [Chloroflexota bacterium]